MLGTFTVKPFRRVVGMTLAASAVCLGPIAAVAKFPEHTIRIIVPFPPGGGADIVARTVGEQMSQELGQTVVIDNKPGAGTIVGTDAVAKSAPDGYTLLIATFAYAVNTIIKPKLPYDAETAFTPVILLGRGPNVMVVRSGSPYKSVADVITAAKAKSGGLTFASQGIGTSAHLAGELFNNLAHVSMTHVPYRGAAPALVDLLGGQVDVMFATAAAVGALIAGGQLVALGVTTSERSPALPNVPTIAEAGVPGFAAESWYGLLAPAHTPPDVIARLNEAANKAVRSEIFGTRVASEGLVAAGGAPNMLVTYVHGEEERWRKIVKENNITSE